MKSARPTPHEERWLALAARLRIPTLGGELAARTGGWRVTGPLARIALFVLGVIAAALVWGLLGETVGLGLAASAVVVLAAAEWLIRVKRLHASGIEEGLVVGASTMLGVWVVDLASVDAWAAPVLAVAFLLAGLRLLNPLLTTLAAFVGVAWLAREPPGLAVDAWLGFGTFAVALACVVALASLAAGAREFRRPSHDRMLDWLVAVLPSATYLYGGGWALALHPEVMNAMAAAGGRTVLAALLLVYAAIALAIGLRRRAHAPLLGAIGGFASVLVEAYPRTGLPVEAWLILCGAAALAAGLVLDRRLRTPREGVTSARLSDREGPLDLLQLAGASVLAHRDTPAAPPGDSLAPGGGRYGGGGSSGTW